MATNQTTVISISGFIILPKQGAFNRCPDTVCMVNYSYKHMLSLHWIMFCAGLQCRCKIPQECQHAEIKNVRLHWDECGYVHMLILSALPAVNYYGSGVSWVDTLDFLEKLEHPNRREWNTKVRPAGEVELGDQPRRPAAFWSLLNLTQNISNCFNMSQTLYTKLEPYIKIQIWKLFVR